MGGPELAVTWVLGTAGQLSPASGRGGLAVPVAPRGGAGRVVAGRGSVEAGRMRPPAAYLVGGRRGRAPRAAAETWRRRRGSTRTERGSGRGRRDKWQLRR